MPRERLQALLVLQKRRLSQPQGLDDTVQKEVKEMMED